jgi:hypothetical protein
MIFNFDTTTWHNYFLENKIDVKVDFDSILFIKVINQSGLFSYNLIHRAMSIMIIQNLAFKSG